MNVITQYHPLLGSTSLFKCLIEARHNFSFFDAGAANYRRIPGMDQQQLLSARIMQRTNLIIMPMVFVSYVLGKGFRTLLGLT